MCSRWLWCVVQLRAGDICTRSCCQHVPCCRLSTLMNLSHACTAALQPMLLVLTRDAGIATLPASSLLLPLLLLCAAVSRASSS